MAECANFEWFDLAGTEDRWTLTDLGRLQCITTSLPDPERQYPSLLFFVGKNLKSMMLQDLHASNRVTRRGAHGIANLLVDPDTRALSHPLLVADCTPEAPCASPRDPWYRCHETHRHPVCGDRVSQATMISRIHANLLFPFTHVVCVFADDLGGNRACAWYIQRWMTQRGSAPGSSVEVHPHLLVTTTCPDNLDVLVQVECQAEFHTVFESFQVLTVSDDAASCGEVFHRALRRLVGDSRRLWRRRHALLNSVNLARMFTRAAEIFSEDTTQPTDFLASSRHPACSLSVADVAVHLQHLRSSSAHVFPESVVVELMASALLVQGYPSDFHREYFVAVGRPGH